MGSNSNQTNLTPIPALITSKDPNAFITHAIEVHTSDTAYHLTTQGPPLSFSAMTALRRPTKYQNLRHPKGVYLANIGVSAWIVVRYQTRNFVLLVRQKQKETGFTHKLVSGYVECQDLSNPEARMSLELCEEILIYSDNDKQLLQLQCQPQPSPHPYEGTAFSLHPHQRIPASPLTRLADWKNERTTYLNKHTLATQPRLYFDQTTNSLQLVYAYTLNLDTIINKNPKAKLSLWHAEDVFYPKHKRLHTELDYHGAVLIPTPIYRGHLLPPALHLHQGELIPATGNATVSRLSGFFDIDENQIATQSWVKQPMSWFFKEKNV